VKIINLDERIRAPNFNVRTNILFVFSY